MVEDVDNAAGSQKSVDFRFTQERRSKKYAFTNLFFAAGIQSKIIATTAKNRYNRYIWSGGGNGCTAPLMNHPKNADIHIYDSIG